MKFKKRLLSEEIGLQKSNRKTYTQNKKQKIVNKSRRHGKNKKECH